MPIGESLGKAVLIQFKVQTSLLTFHLQDLFVLLLCYLNWSFPYINIVEVLFKCKSMPFGRNLLLKSRDWVLVGPECLNNVGCIECLEVSCKKGSLVSSEGGKSLCDS